MSESAQGTFDTSADDYGIVARSPCIPFVDVFHDSALEKDFVQWYYDVQNNPKRARSVALLYFVLISACCGTQAVAAASNHRRLVLFILSVSSSWYVGYALLCSFAAFVARSWWLPKPGRPWPLYYDLFFTLQTIVALVSLSYAPSIVWNNVLSSNSNNSDSMSSMTAGLSFSGSAFLPIHTFLVCFYNFVISPRLIVSIAFHLFLYATTLAWVLLNVNGALSDTLTYPTAILLFMIVVVGGLFGLSGARLLERQYRMAFNRSETFKAYRTYYQFHRNIEESLLRNMFPESIVSRYRAGTLPLVGGGGGGASVGPYYEGFSRCCILCAEWTSLPREWMTASILEEGASTSLSTYRTIGKLTHYIFCRLDEKAVHKKCLKLKTVGDAYWVVTGVPEVIADRDMCYRICEFAFSALAIIQRVHREMATLLVTNRVEYRIGIHTGPIHAGILGHTRVSYDVWGETVDMCSRLTTQHGAPGKIVVSNAMKQLVEGTVTALQEKMDGIHESDSKRYSMFCSPNTTTTLCESSPTYLLEACRGPVRNLSNATLSPSETPLVVTEVEEFQLMEGSLSLGRVGTVERNDLVETWSNDVIIDRRAIARALSDDFLHTTLSWGSPSNDDLYAGLESPQPQTFVLTDREMRALRARPPFHHNTSSGSMEMARMVGRPVPQGAGILVAPPPPLLYPSQSYDSVLMIGSVSHQAAPASDCPVLPPHQHVPPPNSDSDAIVRRIVTDPNAHKIHPLTLRILCPEEEELYHSSQVVTTRDTNLALISGCITVLILLLLWIYFNPEEARGGGLTSIVLYTIAAVEIAVCVLYQDTIRRERQRRRSAEVPAANGTEGNPPSSTYAITRLPASISRACFALNALLSLAAYFIVLWSDRIEGSGSLNNSTFVNVVRSYFWLLMMAVNRFVRRYLPLVPSSVLLLVCIHVNIGSQLYLGLYDNSNWWLDESFCVVVLAINYMRQKTARETFCDLVRIRWDDLRLQAERNDVLALLGNVLPRSVLHAHRHEYYILERKPSCTVVYVDIQFSSFSIGIQDRESVESGPDPVTLFLHHLFCALDDICNEVGLEKIKSFATSYMAVAGAPEQRSDHAGAAATSALRMLRRAAQLLKATPRGGAVRIGVHSGEILAGVLGFHKYSYDIYGETVGRTKATAWSSSTDTLAITAEAMSNLHRSHAMFELAKPTVSDGKEIYVVEASAVLHPPLTFEGQNINNNFYVYH